MSKQLLAKTICIAALVVGCLFVILPVYGQPGDLPTRQEEVPVPSLDVLILVDESETMWNHTDPTGKRVQAVNLFIDQLSLSLTQPGDSHRVGIIAFGTEPEVIPWTSLNSKDDADKLKERYAAVHKGIEPHKNKEYTDINKALAEALEIIKAEHDPGRKSALILISDGQPTCPSPLVNEEQGWDVVYNYLLETRQIIDQFKTVSYSGSLCPSGDGTPLFTMAVGTDVLLQKGKSTQEFVDLYKRSWQSLAYSTGGYYETVAPLDEIGSAVTEVFARLLCGVIFPPGKAKIENTKELPFTVKEDYLQVFFVISGKDSPAITSQVFRPGQENPIQPDDGKIKWRSGTDYEMWSVEYSEPWAGTWRVVLEGKGNVYFSYIRFSPFSIEVQQPSRGAILPVGKPIEIKARVIQKGERPVAVPVQNLKVSVTKPDRTPGEQFNLEERNGIYVGQFDDTDQEGEYELTLNAMLRDAIEEVYESTKVELRTEPWLECVNPAPGSTYESNVSIPLEAVVHLAGSVFPQNVKVKAELLRDGEVAEEVPIDCKKTGESNVLACDGQFQAGHDPGAYVVNMALESDLPSGIPAYDRSIVPIVIVLPPTATRTPTLSPTVTPTPPPTAAPTPTPSPIPPTSTATETPTAISTPSPTATPTGTPTPLPTPTSTATPTLSEALAVAALSNPSQCLLCVWAALTLFLLYMVLRKRPEPEPEPELEPEPPHPFIQEFRDFIAFLKSLWGILAGISVFFPLSNALLKVIPIGTWAQGTGGLVYFSPLLVTAVTTVTALFVILWTFSQRRQLKRRMRWARRQALYFFTFGLLALIIYLVVNFFVVAGCYERVLGWGGDSPLRLLGDVVLLLSYDAFFSLITWAFVLLGIIGFLERET